LHRFVRAFLILRAAIGKPFRDARDTIDGYIDYGINHVIDIRWASRRYPRGFVLIEASR
jgi:hypothetical protein